MSTHTEFGQAADALYTVHAAQSCELEYDVHIDDICNKPPQIGG